MYTYRTIETSSKEFLKTLKSLDEKTFINIKNIKTSFFEMRNCSQDKG